MARSCEPDSDKRGEYLHYLNDYLVSSLTQFISVVYLSCYFKAPHEMLSLWERRN
jgi:hypothetical protein